MYEITVEAGFSAAHALVIAGVRESLHGHDWRVTVAVEAEELDEDGLVCDFHQVEHAVHEVTRTWHNRNMNECEPFSVGVNPSAERVAEEIARRVGGAISGMAGRRLAWVRVTEAPGCAATYRPERGTG